MEIDNMENSKNLFVKEKIDDLREMQEWDLFVSYSIFKQDFADKESDKEMILAYANAINILANQIKEQNHSGLGVVATLRINSLTIPFMFLVRHILELIIKYIGKCCGLKNQKSHRLSELWGQVSSVLKNYNQDLNDERLNYLTDFIKEIELIDDNGMKTRYSHDNNGEINNKKPKFINCDRINRHIQILKGIAEID